MKRWLLVLLIALAPVAARAQSLDDAAKAHFERGQRLAEKNKYAEALAEFSAGYELSHRPLFLFNMGECARQAGDPQAARGYYERYLKADPDGTLSDKARERLDQLPAPPAPAPVPAPAPPPPVKPAPPPAAKLAPPPVEDEPEPEPELRAEHHVDLIPPPPPLHEESRSTPFYKSAPFWIGVGVVVIGGTVAAIALSQGGGSSCSGVCVDLTQP